MLYKVINEWVTEKIALLNIALPAVERLKAADINFDMDFLPANLMESTYLLKLNEIKIEDNESGEIKAITAIEFHFRLFKKPLEYYSKLIDEKLFGLCKILSDDSVAGLEYISDGITISNIHNIKVTGLDKSYKGGEFIIPRIEFELQVFNN